MSTDGQWVGNLEEIGTLKVGHLRTEQNGRSSNHLIEPDDVAGLGQALNARLGHVGDVVALGVGVVGCIKGRSGDLDRYWDRREAELERTVDSHSADDPKVAIDHAWVGCGLLVRPETAASHVPIGVGDDRLVDRNFSLAVAVVIVRDRDVRGGSEHGGHVPAWEGDCPAKLAISRDFRHSQIGLEVEVVISHDGDGSGVAEWFCDGLERGRILIGEVSLIACHIGHAEVGLEVTAVVGGQRLGVWSTKDSLLDSNGLVADVSPGLGQGVVDGWICDTVAIEVSRERQFFSTGQREDQSLRPERGSLDIEGA